MKAALAAAAAGAVFTAGTLYLPTQIRTKFPKVDDALKQGPANLESTLISGALSGLAASLVYNLLK